LSETSLLESPSQAIVSAARGAAGRGGSPASAARVVRGLEQCLRRFDESTRPATAWNFSALNADGSPIELAFSSTDDKLRYTTEAGGPGLSAHARLGVAVDLCEVLGGVAPPSDEVAFWQSLQTGAPLRWGAWLSVRQGESIDRVKIYVEVPSAGRSAAGSERFRLAPDSQLVMLGYDCAGAAYEYYFRQPPVLDPLAFEALQQRHFQSAQHAAVLAAFAELCQVPPRTAMRWINFGYSVAARPDGCEPTLTIFARSRSLGNAARVREFFLTHERNAGKASSTYRDLLESLAPPDLPDHGTVGVSVHDDGRIEARVGLSGGALAIVCKPR
jgi:hypothetical protein